MSDRREVELASVGQRFLDEKQFWDVTYAATLANLGAVMLLIVQELIVFTEQERAVILLSCICIVYVVGLVRSMVLKKLWIRTSRIE